MLSRGFIVGDRILGLSADSHADWCAAYGQRGQYRFVGASAIGKLHLREDRPRDDAFAIRTAGPWLAVAVSDGVGSRQHSRYGSSFAVEALCEHLLREALGIASSRQQLAEKQPTAQQNDKPVQKEAETKPHQSGWLSSLIGRFLTPQREQITLPVAFEVPSLIPPSDEQTIACGTLVWYLPPAQKPRKEMSNEPQSTSVVDEEAIRHAFRRTWSDLEQFALLRGFQLRDLHCTLLGMLLNTETGAVAAGHIGDGLIAALHPGLGAYPIVEAPTPSEVGETYVFTQSNWEEHLAVRVLSPEEAAGITTFYLMTDGVADDCTHPPPEDIFQRWAKDIDREMRKEEPLPQKATRLLRWLATYEVRGSWDDRTLVVVMKI